MKWSSKRDGRFRDAHSDDGHWWIATGYDEVARKKLRQPWSLFFRKKSPGPWKKVDTFKTQSAAKEAAKELANDYD